MPANELVELLIRLNLAAAAAPMLSSDPPWRTRVAVAYASPGRPSTTRGVTKISSSLRLSLYSLLLNRFPRNGTLCRYGSRDWRSDLSTPV